MNNAPHPYGIDETLDYLDYLKSLKTISDSFQGVINETIQKIENIKVFRAGSKSIGHTDEELIMPIHTRCKVATSHLGKRQDDIDYEIFKLWSSRQNNRN